MKRAPSLLRRQLLVQLALLAGAWLLLGAITLGGIFAAGAGLLDRDIRTTSEALARFASVAPDGPGSRAVLGHMQAIVATTTFPRPRAEEIAFRVWSADGTLLARSDDPLADLAPAAALAGEARADGWRFGGATSPDGRVQAAIGFSADYLARLRMHSIRNLALPFAALSLLLVLGAWIAARAGLAPLRRLAEQIEGRPVGELAPVTTPKQYAEVEPIVRALNAQLRGTADRLERERRFFAEAAHELRTPLAVLSVQAHVVANEADPVRRREALVALETGIDRSARVVQRLLTLARLDAARPGEPLEPLDVGELVEEVVAGLQARAAASGHVLRVVDASPVILSGAEEGLRSAIENLIDNALRYTPAGTTIEVRVWQQAESCLVEVLDDGPGIDAEYHARVFGRFDRLGRRSDEGTGLGLAIVKRVAELHGGHATFVPGDGGRGCRFRIRLPVRVPEDLAP